MTATGYSVSFAAVENCSDSSTVRDYTRERLDGTSITLFKKKKKISYSKNSPLPSTLLIHIN